MWTGLPLLRISFEFIRSDRAAVLMSNPLGCGVPRCQSGVSQLNGQLWSSRASCLAPTQQNNYSCHVEWLASVGAVFPFSSILAHLLYVHAKENEYWVLIDTKGTNKISIIHQWHINNFSSFSQFFKLCFSVFVPKSPLDCKVCQNQQQLMQRCPYLPSFQPLSQISRASVKRRGQHILHARTCHLPLPGNALKNLLLQKYEGVSVHLLKELFVKCLICEFMSLVVETKSVCFSVGKESWHFGLWDHVFKS